MEGVFMFLDCDEIIEGRLWVGRYVLPDHLEFLRRMDINAIVNLQSDEDLTHYQIPMDQIRQAFSQAGIRIHRVPIIDFNRDSLSYNLPQAVLVLKVLLVPPKSKVYVHCIAGVNRGPTLAAAYLMKAQGYSSREAYAYVKERRHCEPYLSVLEEYETNLKKARDSF